MSEQTARAMRLRFIAAVEQRAGGHEGAVRHLLDARLSGMPSTATEHAVDQASTKAASTPARSALAALVDEITNHATAQPSTFPELAVLGEFRQRWSAIRAESQLQQSLQPVPGNAGPLNSAGLVHRSIALMRELSPGYLQQFLAYVDDLAWMERLAASGAYVTGEAPNTTGPGKRSRRKFRT